jgi:MOSC domain-containing protein YiiM
MLARVVQEGEVAVGESVELLDVAAPDASAPATA